MKHEAVEHASAYPNRVRDLNKRLFQVPRRSPKTNAGPGLASLGGEPKKAENRRAAASERAAAQLLITSLAHTYSVDVAAISGDVWERYRRFMLDRWGLGEAESFAAIECLRGFRNRRIALRLGLGTETVNRQLDQVYRKAGVRGRAELAAILLQLAANGLLAIEEA